MTHLTRMGIDVAKHVFQLHGVDAQGHPVLCRRVARAHVRPIVAQLRPCLIGLEACGSAHYWARELTKLGHTVRLIAPQFVAPYRKNDKNDGNDAEAICEAVGRPHMRFVPIKSVAQQAVLTVHRARQLLVAERTALVNQSRGLLAEYGLIVPVGGAARRRAWGTLLEAPELRAVAARVRGSGAGMEPPPDAVLRDGWYEYRPGQSRHEALLLARSRHVPDYELCTAAAGCRPLSSLLSSDGGVTRLTACTAP